MTRLQIFREIRAAMADPERIGDVPALESELFGARARPALEVELDRVRNYSLGFRVAAWVALLAAPLRCPFQLRRAWRLQDSDKGWQPGRYRRRCYEHGWLGLGRRYRERLRPKRGNGDQGGESAGDDAWGGGSDGGGNALPGWSSDGPVGGCACRSDEGEPGAPLASGLLIVLAGLGRRRPRR